LYVQEEATAGDRSTAPAETTVDVNQLGLDDIERRPCQTAGCKFYALQQHHWMCSRCYANESTGSQSASSTCGHLLQMTPYTKAQSIVEEQEPQWTGNSNINSPEIVSTRCTKTEKDMKQKWRSVERIPPPRPLIAQNYYR